jgi:hypothetical protein
MKITDIKIDKDFQNCLPDLTADEYTRLEKSIVKRGMQYPVVLWNGYLVDGHNRYKICKAHGVTDIKAIDVYFDNKEDVIAWILDTQLGRRNLSEHQRNLVALRYKDIIAARARKRQSEAGGDKISGKASAFGQMTKSGQDPINTRAELAKISGTNETSIRRSEYIENNGTDEQKERAMKGGKGNSLGTISREIRENCQPMRICSRCGKRKPLSEVYEQKGSCVCKECERKRHKKDKEKESTAFDKTIERLKSGETTPYTAQDVLNELKGCADGLIFSWKQIIQEHLDIINQNEDIVNEAGEYLTKRLKEETYHEV